ncbi:hypothetical protein HAX54_021123, partial [Datura stramonium]|nr:hypothetical protein [Datura stramonium]
MVETARVQYGGRRRYWGWQLCGDPARQVCGATVSSCFWRREKWCFDGGKGRGWRGFGGGSLTNFVFGLGWVVRLVRRLGEERMEVDQWLWLVGSHRPEMRK